MHKVSASTKNDRTSKSNNSEMMHNRLIGRVINEVQKLYKKNKTLKLGVLCFDSYSHSAYIGLQEMDNVLYSVVFTNTKIHLPGEVFFLLVMDATN